MWISIIYSNSNDEFSHGSGGVGSEQLYSNTTAMSTSFDRLHRRTNDAKEEITLPSYSDDVRIDLETDEI